MYSFLFQRSSVISHGSEIKGLTPVSAHRSGAADGAVGCFWLQHFPLVWNHFRFGFLLKAGADFHSDGSILHTAIAVKRPNNIWKVVETRPFTAALRTLAFPERRTLEHHECRGSKRGYLTTFIEVYEHFCMKKTPGKRTE